MHGLERQCGHSGTGHVRDVLIRVCLLKKAPLCGLFRFGCGTCSTCSYKLSTCSLWLTPKSRCVNCIEYKRADVRYKDGISAILGQLCEGDV